MLHQIGVGALGPVFRTYEPTRDRLVAVKVFRLDITPEQARTLADELARATEAQLFHPSVVEPIAAGIEGTVAYRADEYVAAESLDAAMRHYAPASVEKVLPFITQLAGAIDFARAAGVGHGALHPRDIFVTPDEARATGFGVVDALERVGLRAPVRRPYTPPERVAGSAWGTPADVFSLAVIAFELLTGRRPAGTGEQIGALTGGSVSGHADLIRAVLARAMDEDPAARYPTALGFADALEKAARGEVAAAAAVPVATVGVAVDSPPTVAEPVAAGERTVLAEPAPDEVVAEREEEEGEPEPSTGASAAVIEASAGRPMADEVDLELNAGPKDEARDRSAGDVSLQMAAAPEPPPPAHQPVVRDRAADRPRPGPVVAPFDSRPAARPRRPPPTVFDTHDALPEHDLVGIEAAPAERAPITMLPLAITLIVGLLVGFVAGYVVGGRPEPAADEALASPDLAGQPGGQTGAPGPAGTSSSPAREFSEQTVAPTQPAAAPPAAVPDSPPESPSSSAAGAGAPASARPASRRGRIVVRSTPAGAAVTVNGDWRGRTPLPLDDLAFGTHVIRVVQPGYDVIREEVTLSAAEPSRVLSVRLNKQASAPAPARTAPAPREPATQIFTGSVFVDSRPRGAKVTLDGKEYGTTPMTIPDVPVGSHVIRLELPDHRHWTNSITVTAGQRTPVTGSLEPIR